MKQEHINVKLTIWGTNQGSQIFATDLSEEERIQLREALQEFPTVFLNPNIAFYGLEFTAQYKVYTAYYSAQEPKNGRNGIFLAATIFVPHSHRLLDPLGYLQSLGKRTQTCFLDPNGRYIRGIPPTLEREFKEFREQGGEPETIKRTGFLSSPRADLAYIICPDDNSIAQLLSEPYREEFKAYQEILLIPQQDVVKGRFSPSIGQPLELNSLSRQVNGYKLQRNPLITQVSVNGVDRSIDYDKCELGEQDELNYRLQRRGYHDIEEKASVHSLLSRNRLRLQAYDLLLKEEAHPWAKRKRTIIFPIEANVFEETKEARLKLSNDIAHEIKLKASTVQFNAYEVELEEDSLEQSAVLTLYKRVGRDFVKIKLDRLSDAEHIKVKCLEARYPLVSSIDSSHSHNKGKSGDSHLLSTGGKDGAREPWRNPPNPIEPSDRRDREYTSPVKFLMAYWMYCLLTILLTLLLGYLLGFGYAKGWFASTAPASASAEGLPTDQGTPVAPNGGVPTTDSVPSKEYRFIPALVEYCLAKYNTKQSTQKYLEEVLENATLTDISRIDTLESKLKSIHENLNKDSTRNTDKDSNGEQSRKSRNIDLNKYHLTENEIHLIVLRREKSLEQSSRNPNWNNEYEKLMNDTSIHQEIKDLKIDNLPENIKRQTEGRTIDIRTGQLNGK